MTLTGKSLAKRDYTIAQDVKGHQTSIPGTEKTTVEKQLKTLKELK